VGTDHQRAVSKPAARLGVPAILLLGGSGLLGSASVWAQAADTASPKPSWESCLTEQDMDQRVSRYKASVEQYRQQVAELEQELGIARRLAEKKLDTAPPSCEPPQSILEELSNVRSALAVRNEEVKRLQSRLQFAESGDGASTAPPRVPAPVNGGQVRNLQAQLAAAQREINQRSENQVELREKLQRYGESLNTYVARIDRLETQLAAATAGEAAPSSADGAQLAQLQAQLKLTQQQNESLRADIERLNRVAGSDTAELQTQVATLSTELASLRTQLADRDQSLLASKSGRDQLSNTLRAQAETIDALQQQLVAARGETRRTVAASAQAAPAAKDHDATTPMPAPTAPPAPESVAAVMPAPVRPRTEVISRRSARAVGRADVYEIPSLKSARIGFIDDGRPLSVTERSLDTQPAWYRVRTVQGSGGWVRSEQLELSDAQ